MAKQNRQTISYLTRRFAEVGLEPNKRHGQNFLIDLNLIELLARTADINSNDVVLEVGTGMGSLTTRMAERAAAIVTVEIDQYLFQLAREELERFENVTMLQQDALRNKNHYADNVLDTIRKKLAAGPGRQFKLASNLPYNIATPAVSNLLASDITPATMTVTIQKELADRMVATPRTKDYSALSIWMQSQCDIEIVRVMQPSVFWPRPKVQSAIVHIVFRPEKRKRIKDVDFFHQFVRSMFFHRRKFFRSVAISAFKNELEKPDVDAVMAQMDLGTNTRAEELSVEQMIELGHLFQAAIENKSKG